MAKSKATYPGQLGKPILPIPRSKMLAWTLKEMSTGVKEGGGRAHEMAQQEQAGKLFAKIPLLFRHFEIEEGNYIALAMALAIRHVPGFSVAKGRPGAKTTWQPFDVALLRFHIEMTQAETGLRFASAARIVAKRGEWEALLRQPGRGSGETLRRRAQAADKGLVRDLHNAFRYESEEEFKQSPPTVAEFVRKYLDMKSA